MYRSLRFIPLAVLACLTADCKPLSGSLDSQPWVMVHESGFEVALPREPKHKAIAPDVLEFDAWPYTLTIRKLQTAVALEDEGAVLASAAEAGAEQFVKSHNGKLLSRTSITLGLHTGTESEVAVNKQPLVGTYRWRTFIHRNRLFQLYVYADQGEKSDSARFFQSFRFTD